VASFTAVVDRLAMGQEEKKKQKKKEGTVTASWSKECCPLQYGPRRRYLPPPEAVEQHLVDQE
jgi:hypothetical protein